MTKARLFSPKFNPTYISYLSFESKLFVSHLKKKTICKTFVAWKTWLICIMSMMFWVFQKSSKTSRSMFCWKHALSAKKWLLDAWNRLWHPAWCFVVCENPQKVLCQKNMESWIHWKNNKIENSWVNLSQEIFTNI